MATLLQRSAATLSASPIFSGARALYAQNEEDFHLPLSKAQKLYSGLYIILKDFSDGSFPPRFEDQRAAYDAEISYREQLPGVEQREIGELEMRKPFGFGRLTYHYLDGFKTLLRMLESLEIRPPASLLEFGCGSGWLAEFLSLSNYEILGTTISPTDVAEAKRRTESLRCRGLDPKLDFLAAPMESVKTDRQFDAIYVYEALHHAYDWEKTFAEAKRLLKPGGWFLICNEPNLIHTFVSYRVGKLSNTHEIGLSKRKMTEALERLGFTSVKSFGARMHCYLKPHWLAAQKGMDW